VTCPKKMCDRSSQSQGQMAGGRSSRSNGKNLFVETASELHRFRHKPSQIKVFRQPSTLILHNFTGNNIAHSKGIHTVLLPS